MPRSARRRANEVSRERRDRTRGIGAPLAPGSRIEPAAGKAGELEGEDVVAGRDARAAHVHRLFGRCRAQEFRELAAQLLRSVEAPVGIEVLLPEAVHGAWDVTRDRIDRLLQALEALGGA